MKTRHKKPRLRRLLARGPRKAISPRRLDPTRTATLRRAFAAGLRRRFRSLLRDLRKLVVEEDSFGLARQKVWNAERGKATLNTRWKAMTDPDKVRAFQNWLRSRLGHYLVTHDHGRLWEEYAALGFKKGQGRAWDDVRRVERMLAEWEDEGPGSGEEVGGRGSRLDFYRGSRDEFLRSAFGRPVVIDKIKLLAGRSFDDLKGVTADMSLRMSRVLVDGLVRGASPREVGRDLEKELDLGRARAETIARTEIVRAHAEGQLDGLKNLGVTEVGVEVEWSTAGDDRVCPRCADMEGEVMTVDEARGLIPLHPNCRCAWVPAGVGEGGAVSSEGDEGAEALEEV